MKDITSIGTDLVILDSQAPKAANVLTVQLGSLEYLQDFGVDIRFFLDENYQFQNDSFKSYLIQRLSESHINVADVMTELDTFMLKYTFYVGDKETSSEGFMSR